MHIEANQDRLILSRHGLVLSAMREPFNNTATKHGFYSVGTGQLDTIQAIPVNTFGYVANAPLIIFDGNSLTAGSGSTGYPMPTLVMQTFPSYYDFINWGISGQTTSTMNTNLSTNITPFLSRYSGAKVYVMWEALNEMRGSTTAAQAYNNYVTLATAAKAAGFTKVIAVTPTPCTGAATAADYETKRQTFISSVNSAVNPPWDAVAAVGSDATIGVAGASDNTTYYNADKIHLNNTGYAIAAPIISSALTAVGL